MKVKIGHMACPDCGKNVAVKRNEHETLSYGCDECDGNGYCKKHEERYAMWMAKITLLKPPPVSLANVHACDCNTSPHLKTCATVKNKPAPVPPKKPNPATIV